MNFDPLNIERTEWRINKPFEIFNKTISLFPQLIESELEVIKERFEDDSIDYLELAHYERPSEEQKDPSAILVFQNSRVFLDIVDLDRKEDIIGKFKELCDSEAEFIKSRKISKKELATRLDALMKQQLMDDIANGDVLAEEEVEFGDEVEEFFDSVPKNEDQVLDRDAFYLVAKEPVLSWLCEAEKMEPRRLLPLGKLEWTLDKINSEPTVFLVPVTLEFYTKNEQNKIWKKIKLNAFKKFLASYYYDESYWPSNLTEELFNSWFDIKQLGLVVDLVDNF